MGRWRSDRRLGARWSGTRTRRSPGLPLHRTGGSRPGVRLLPRKRRWRASSPSWLLLDPHALRQAFLIQEEALFITTGINEDTKRIAKAEDEESHGIHAQRHGRIATLHPQV